MRVFLLFMGVRGEIRAGIDWFRPYYTIKGRFCQMRKGLAGPDAVFHKKIHKLTFISIEKRRGI